MTDPTNASGKIVDIICFASGTLIHTAEGAVPVEHLQVSDHILTYDQGYQPLRWIGSCSLTPAQLQANPKLLPTLIRADALGPGYPKQDLIVSPQHRVLAASAIVRRMFGRRDVLIPAHKLLPLDGVGILDDPTSGLTYWHLLFDDNQIVWSNGAPTESLFTGPEALKAVSPASAAEIKTLFPRLSEPGFKPAFARHIPAKGRLMRKLVQRHQMNDKPVFAPH